MGYAQERDRLHKYIDKADDNMIRMIGALVNVDIENRHKELEKRFVDEGLKDIEKGNVFTDEEVMRELKSDYPDLFE